MNVRVTWWLLGVVLLSGLLGQQASANGICLFRPYITSIRTLEYTNNGTNISMEFELDYTTYISLHNLTYNPKTKIINHSGTWMRYEGRRTYGSIDYAKITNTQFSYTKENYLRGLDRYWNKDGALVSNAIEVGDECNDVIISSAIARFNEQPDEKGYEKLWFYSNYLRCVWKVKPAMWDGLMPSNFVGLIRQGFYPGSDSEEIVSAAYRNPFLFELTANSAVYLTEMQQNGTNLSRVEQWTFARWFESDRCNRVNKEAIEIIDPGMRRDYIRSLPFRSVSKLTPDSFITIDFITHKLDLWNRSGPEEPLHEAGTYSLKFLSIEHKDLNLEAISSLPDEKESHTHAIFSDRDNSKLVYYRDINIGNTNTPNSQVYTYKNVSAPDDITHWTTCKKIITVYGFAYTMHNYSDNILNDLSSWFRLERQWLDYRIEAMHAEGDEFWFFTKKTVVIKMRADPENCGTLQLSYVGEFHYREAFGQVLKRGYYLEGRYYDGSQWVPSFEPPGPNLIWLYAVVGVTGLILVIALAELLRRYHKKQNVIYSKAQTSLVEGVGPSGKSPTIWKDPISRAESALPLFSEHESGLKKKTSPRRSRKSVSPSKKLRVSIRSKL